MCRPLLSTNNLILSVPFCGPGCSHPILPVERADWELNIDYIMKCLIRRGCLSIIPTLQHLPQTYRFTAPIYSVTFHAIQRQPKYLPRLAINEKDEIWTEDGFGCLRRMVVGECQGQIEGFFIFPCWGCNGICDSAHEHQSCPYGIMKVRRDFLHPSFNSEAVPEFPLLGYVINEIWRNIPPDNHLCLALVYPPGYAPEITAWYDRYLPVAVFTVEKEEEMVEQEKAQTLGFKCDKSRWMRSLMRDSEIERHSALLARDLASRVAELCQAACIERAHRRLLRSTGITI